MTVEAIFYKGPEDILGKLIRLWTRSSYSHCELHFGDGNCWSAWPGQGTRWTKRYLRDQDWDRIPISGIENLEVKLRRWCDSENGCKYDWRGIFFSQVFPWGWHSNHRWFCSEACSAGLVHIGLLPGIKPWQLSPRKFAEVLRVRLP